MSLNLKTIKHRFFEEFAKWILQEGESLFLSPSDNQKGQDAPIDTSTYATTVPSSNAAIPDSSTQSNLPVPTPPGIAS